MIENKQNLLVTLNVGDLKKLIQEAIKDELKNFTNQIQTSTIPDKDESDILLTREEASKILKVSYTTLFNWNKDGILPIEKLGKRVYYPKSRIMKKLNCNQTQINQFSLLH